MALSFQHVNHEGIIQKGKVTVHKKIQFYWRGKQQDVKTSLKTIGKRDDPRQSGLVAVRCKTKSLDDP